MKMVIAEISKDDKVIDEIRILYSQLIQMRVTERFNVYPVRV